MAKKTVPDDPFDTLVESATKVESVSKKKKQDKPSIELDTDEKLAFEAFCAADIIAKMSEGKQKTAKSIILPVLRRKLIEKWAELGHKTENPVVVTDRARANFIVREVLKVETLEGEDSVADRLIDAGFDEQTVERICEKEFIETTEVRLAPLNELRNGTATERELAQRLSQLIVANFNKQEQAILLKKERRVEIADDFLARAVPYCNGDADKLDALLSIVTPQWVMSHMTYSGKDLTQIVSELTGGELPTNVGVRVQEFFSKDKEWKAVTKGAEASLYYKDELRCTKKCNGGPDHAIMTAKKWLNDPEYRETSIQALNK